MQGEKQEHPTCTAAATTTAIATTHCSTLVALATKKNSQKRYKKTHQGTRIEITGLRKLQTTMMLKSSHGSATVFEAD